MNEGTGLNAPDPTEETSPSRPSEQGPADEGRYTRIAATIVLLVASPMLLLSGLALAAFFAFPDRFNNILARLPGEAAIRTVLIFAPSALLAIIVLALLYALEPPEKEVGARQPTHEAGPTSPWTGWISQVGWGGLSTWLLLMGVPATLLLVSARSAAFLSPERFGNFLDRIPGGAFFEFFMGAGFILVLAVGLIGLLFFTGTSEEKGGGESRLSFKLRRWFGELGPERLSVGTVLLFTIPILALSLLALTGFLARPSRVLDLLTQLPKEAILRLGLLFLPSSLFIVVVLAVLVLPRRLLSEESLEEMVRSGGSFFDRTFQFLLTHGSWVLYGGLTIGLAVIFGLVVGVIVLLLH
jgi:hypothetical protein